MTRAVEEFLPAEQSPLLAGGAEDAFVVVVGVLLLAGAALVLWLLVRLRLVRRAGTARPGARSRAPLEERLQELDDLHRRGLISDEERAAARQRALTSP